MQLTPEELQKMSPEQIAELQKQNCIFCHIISGKVASKKIYEDEKVTAILDINPANPGHVLLLPKEHYAIMPLMPEEIIGHMFMVAKGISHACLRAFKAQGTNIFVANGVAAGQKAQHFMIHIIPRKEKDGITCFSLPRKKISDEQVEGLRNMLKPKINSFFGVREEAIDLDKTRKVEQLKKEAMKIEDEIKAKESREKAKPKAEEEEVEAEIIEEEQEEKKEGQGEKKTEDIDLDRIAELLGAKKGW